MHPAHYIADNAAARKLAAELTALTAADAVAVDTEFIRVREYYPKLALLQLHFNGAIYLIDPLACDLSLVLPSLLSTKAAFLVFAGTEDLQILNQQCIFLTGQDLIPAHYVDLQILAAFAGHSYGRGLYTLVKDLCGIELNKEQTLSDWLQRPLTPEQLNYAALDVAYLPDLYQALTSPAAPLPLHWFELEMAESCARITAPPEPETAYRAVAGAGLLNPQQRFVLQQLCARRLRLAMEKDEALNRVITTKALCEIARRLPQTPEGLAGCGMKWAGVREYGGTVLSWLDQIKTMPPKLDLPLPMDTFAHVRSLQDAYRRLRRQIEKKAEAAGIMPQLLGGKRMICDFYLSHYEGREGWLERSWRRELLGPLPPPELKGIHLA